MKAQWLQHLNSDKAKQEEFRRHLHNCKDGFARLESILESMYSSEWHRIIGAEDFNKPNWPEMQAYRNGKMQAYKEIKHLLEGLT